MDTNSILSQSESISIIPLRGAAVSVFWPVVGPMLQRAIDHGAGELELSDVYTRLFSHDMQLLIAVSGKEILAAFVTEVIKYPRKKVLRVVLSGGHGARKWRRQLREALHLGAKNIGASSIEIYGRAGWLKVLDVFPTVRLKYYVIAEELQ